MISSVALHSGSRHISTNSTALWAIVFYCVQAGDASAKYASWSSSRNRQSWRAIHYTRYVKLADRVPHASLVNAECCPREYFENCLNHCKPKNCYYYLSNSIKFFREEQSFGGIFFESNMSVTKTSHKLILHYRTEQSRPLRNIELNANSLCFDEILNISIVLCTLDYILKVNMWKNRFASTFYKRKRKNKYETSQKLVMDCQNRIHGSNPFSILAIATPHHQIDYYISQNMWCLICYACLTNYKRNR